MKYVIIYMTYDEDQVSVEEIRDSLKEFITEHHAYMTAHFHKES